MSFHEQWLKQLESYKVKIKETTGTDLQLPPPSAVELKLEYLELVPGKKMVAKLPYQRRFTNPVGTYQGGMLAAGIDDVFGPLSYASTGRPCLSLSLNTTFLKAFTEAMGECQIEARILQQTKSFIFLHAEVKSPQGELIAHAESHMTIMRDDQMQKVKT